MIQPWSSPLPDEHNNKKKILFVNKYWYISNNNLVQLKVDNNPNKLRNKNGKHFFIGKLSIHKSS